MRVLLINTPALYERPVSRSMAGGLGFDANADMILPPLDLAYLAAYLRAGGHEVDLFDADGMACDRAATLRKVSESGWDALVAAASLPTLYGDCAFLRELRDVHRGPVYAKTNVPDRGVLAEMLERGGADGVIYGEPEASICGIVEGRTTDNLVCRRDGEILYGERTSVEDVDRLLMPARDLLPNDRYTYPLLGRGLATVQSSRGCPFPCGFYCPYPLVEGKVWRARSPGHVVEELEEIVAVHRIDRVLFRDATFTLDKDRAHAICDRILEKGLKLTWWAETRVDRLDRPLLEKLRAAGCVGLNIGVETGDEQVMAGQAKRGLSMEKLIRLRNDAKEIGLALHFLMLVGFPDETRRSILASYDLIQDLQPESLGITLITPYPGTPLHEEASRRGWIEPGTTWVDYGGHQPVMHTDRMTSGELVHGLQALHRGFGLLRMRGKVDAAELQRALDEDYMRLQRWAAEEGDRPSSSPAASGKSLSPPPSPVRTGEGGGQGVGEGRPDASRLTPAPPEPLLSVIIPTYNRKGDLARCLKALDAQTLPGRDFEAIVCDDGSTDGTPQTMEGRSAERPYGLRYIRQENRGPAAARNAGIRAASGRIVLFLGDDIAADPRLLERHVAAHRNAPAERAVLGHTAWPADMPVNELMRYITEVGSEQFGFHRIKDHGNVPFGFFYTSNISIGREFLLGSDLFDEGFPYAAFEDIELEYRLRKRGLKMIYLPDAVGYHYHPTDLARFSERQYRAGLSAVYFRDKHADPDLDAGTLRVSQLLAKTLPADAEIERLKAAAAEIEKMDLSRFAAITVGDRPLEAQMREVLHTFYATVLSMYYLKGVHDGAKEGMRQPATGDRPSPSAPLSRRTGEGETSDSERGRGPASRLTPQDSPVVSIIIPVHNNLPFTRKCLETIFDQDGEIPFELILVDNASTDGTRAYLESLGDRILPIFNDENAGFGAANNRGVARARGRYLLFLNNDTEARVGWMTEMVRLMESDDRVGIVGSKLLFPDGTIQHVGVAFYENCQPNHLYRGEPLADHPIANRVRDMQAVTGACLMLRRGVVREPEVFDEAFRNGCEDVDLCLRVRELGYRVVYCPSSVLVHHESKTPGRKVYDIWNNRLLKERWSGRVEADFEETMAQDGFVRDPRAATRWTWDPSRLQAPRPRPPLGPKRREPVLPRVSLILPVRDRLPDLDRCLKGIVRNAGEAAYEILVLDNGSTDGTVRYLEMLSDEPIKAILNGEDPGLALSVERALKVARGEFLLFLTPDASPGAGWIRGMLSPLESESGLGAVREGRTALAIRRTAFDALGGIGSGAGLEAAMEDLCDRAEKASIRVEVTGFRSEVQDPDSDPKPGTRDLRLGTHPEVSIVIPVYNGLEDTRRCLPALAETTKDAACEVILVDNASTDGTAEFLEGEAARWHGRLRVLRHERNLGFAKGCNAGAGVARGKYVLFLNNDTLPRPGWLREMLHVMAFQERVGVVGSKLLYPDTGLVQHAGIELINGVPDHPFRGLPADDPRVCRTRELDMVTGACLMMPKDLFERLGGFDEGYRNGVEDVDLCLRARDAGYRVIYCASSVVEHHEGRTAGRFDRVRENLQRFVARWNGRFDASGHFIPERREAPRPRGVWEGSFFVRHSLALVNREICGALIRTGACDLSLVPYEPDDFGPESDPERLAPLAERMGAALDGPAEFHVRHQWPPRFDPPPSGHWVMIQPWEYGSLPKPWVEPMTNRVDEIWVPSRFVRECYIESGVPAAKVHVVPNGVNADLFRPDAPPLDLPTRKTFRFLFVGGTIYRKGIDILLEAYAKAFRRSDDVCLVIKDMGQATFYKGQNAEERIRELQADPGAPEILYLTDPLSDREVAGLYAACNCLVHPYRGEGFGLPVAEAMACGLPVIVTRGGACDDFCDEETAYFVPARRVNIAIAEETAGQPWLLEPDREALADRMRWVASNAAAARETGARAAGSIRTRVTWERAAAAVRARLDALRGRPILRGAGPLAAGAKASWTAVRVASGSKLAPLAAESLERHAGPSCERLSFDGSAEGSGLMAFLADRRPSFRGDAVAIVSDSVLILPGVLERMRAVLEADPSIGMVVPVSGIGTGEQSVKPTYRNLKKELEKFGRKVAHDRKGLTADVPWPETPCVLVRLSALDPGLLESLRPFRTVAGLQALARLLRKAGVRVVCCRDACVHADPEAGADPPRAREDAAVRALARAEAADDPAAARVEARAAADAMPDWAEAQNELGKRSYRQGETESARIAFERAAALSPDWAEPHGNLGVMFWEAGDADRAVEAFNRAVAIEPENADVLYNVGMIYEQVGDSRRAALFFERCRALRPDDPDVRSRLEAIRVTSPEMATAP